MVWYYLVLLTFFGIRWFGGLTSALPFPFGILAVGGCILAAAGILAVGGCILAAAGILAVGGCILAAAGGVTSAFLMKELWHSPAFI